MNARVVVTASFVLAIMLGCGAPRTTSSWRPSGQIETLPDGTKVICQMERATGTNIAEPVCRRLDEIEKARAEAQIELLRPRATPATRR